MKKTILLIFSIVVILSIGCKNLEDNTPLSKNGDGINEKYIIDFSQVKKTGTLQIPWEKSSKSSRVSNGIEYFMYGAFEECTDYSGYKTITIRVSSGDYQAHDNVKIGLLIQNGLELISSSVGFGYGAYSYDNGYLDSFHTSYVWDIGYLSPYNPQVINITVRFKGVSPTAPPNSGPSGQVENTVGVWLYGVDGFMSSGDQNLKNLINKRSATTPCN